MEISIKYSAKEASELQNWPVHKALFSNALKYNLFISTLISCDSSSISHFIVIHFSYQYVGYNI